MDTNTTIETVEKSNYPAIFDLPELPGQSERDGPKYYFTPWQLKAAIDKYAIDARNIDKIAAEAGIRDTQSIYKALFRYPEIAAYYKRAGEMHAELLIDKTIEIADDDSKDLLPGKFGPVGNSAAVRRSEARIKAYQWTAARLNRARWGDKQEVDLKQTTTNVNIDITPASFDKRDISDVCQIFTAK